jgi:hypothetical protein
MLTKFFQQKPTCFVPCVIKEEKKFGGGSLALNDKVGG